MIVSVECSVCGRQLAPIRRVRILVRVHGPRHNRCSGSRHIAASVTHVEIVDVDRHFLVADHVSYWAEHSFDAEAYDPSGDYWAGQVSVSTGGYDCSTFNTSELVDPETGEPPTPPADAVRVVQLRAKAE